MNNINLPITSREYKLMLNVAHFKAREQGIKEFWELVKFLAISQGAKITALDDESNWYKEQERKTYYLDTEGLELKRKGFILRVREEVKKQDKEYKLTLKYRSSDRYLSASQHLSLAQLDTLALPKITKKSKKFEEDIVPPFSSKFSHSISLESKQKIELNTVNDLKAIFISLKEINISNDQELKIVNNFVANELALKINHRIIFAPAINGYQIKPCLSFWYLLGSTVELPLVGEFSFDYDSAQEKSESLSEEQQKLERFPLQVVQGANRWFATTQKQVNWLNSNSTTKTAYAYEGFASNKF